MTWQLTWGKTGRVDFLKKLSEAGTHVPALANRPNLSQWVIEYFNAFNLLSESRNITASGYVCPIPLTEIAAYLSMFPVGGMDEREYFIMMIRTLDSVYLEHVNSRVPNE